MIEQLFLTMVNLTYRGGMILLLIFLIRPVIRRASQGMGFCLWGLAGVRLLCSWTPGFLRSSHSLLPRGDLFTLDLLAASPPTIPTRFTELGDPLRGVELPVAPETMVYGLQLLGWIWLGGFAFLLLIGLVSYYRLKKRMAESICIGESIYVCSHLTSPFSMGIFRRRIYLPPGLSEEEKELVIAHEKTHLSRRDPMWKLAAYVLAAFHWMNPLVWIGYRCFGKDMELSCDERVFQWFDQDRKGDYCRALLALTQGKHLFCPAAFAEGGVKGRVKNLLRKKKVGIHKIQWKIGAFICLLIVFFVGMTRRPGASAYYSIPTREFLLRLVQAMNRTAEQPHLLAGLQQRDWRVSGDDTTVETFFEMQSPDYYVSGGVLAYTDRADFEMDLLPVFKGDVNRSNLYMYKDGEIVFQAQDYPYRWRFAFDHDGVRVHAVLYTHSLSLEPLVAPLLEFIQLMEDAPQDEFLIPVQNEGG